MEIEPRLAKLEKEIELIKERNKKVEADKSWETSFSRKFLLILTTYLVIVLFMHFAEIKSPWINAVVPSIGFYLLAKREKWKNECFYTSEQATQI